MVRVIDIVTYVLDLYTLALRWACLARYLGDINAEEFIRQSCYRSRLLDEALENLYLGNRMKVSSVTLFATGKQYREAP